MKTMGSKPLTAERTAQVDALAAMPDSTIDTSDIPEVTDWSGARRGMFAARMAERGFLVELDPDLLAWFKADLGERYEAGINLVLRHHVEGHARKAG